MHCDQTASDTFLPRVKSYCHGFEYPFVKEYPWIVEKLTDFLNSGRSIVWLPQGRRPLDRVEIETLAHAVDELISDVEFGGQGMSLEAACEILSKESIGGITRSADAIKKIYRKVAPMFVFVFPDGSRAKESELLGYKIEAEEH